MTGLHVRDGGTGGNNRPAVANAEIVTINTLDIHPTKKENMMYII